MDVRRNGRTDLLLCKTTAVQEALTFEQLLPAERFFGAKFARNDACCTGDPVDVQRRHGLVAHLGTDTPVTQLRANTVGAITFRRTLFGVQLGETEITLEIAFLKRHDNGFDDISIEAAAEKLIEEFPTGVFPSGQQIKCLVLYLI